MLFLQKKLALTILVTHNYTNFSSVHDNMQTLNATVMTILLLGVFCFGLSLEAHKNLEMHKVYTWKWWIFFIPMRNIFVGWQCRLDIMIYFGWYFEMYFTPSINLIQFSIIIVLLSYLASNFINILHSSVIFNTHLHVLLIVMSLNQIMTCGNVNGPVLCRNVLYNILNNFVTNHHIITKYPSHHLCIGGGIKFTLLI